MGIPVMMGQRAENIKGADLIVYSAAIMEDNPGIAPARIPTSVPSARANRFVG